MTVHPRGVVHVAVTAGQPWFLNQCVRSIASLRAFCDLPVSLFCDRPDLAAVALDGLPNVDIVPLPATKSAFKLKVEAQIRAPYERHVFMDSDTYVLEDFSELLDRLDEEDFLIANDAERRHDPSAQGSWTYRICGVKGTGLNTGMFALRKSDAVNELLRTWLARVDTVDDGDLRQGQGDQKYFNILYRSGWVEEAGVSLAVVENRLYNALYPILPYLRSAGELHEVKILHSKKMPKDIGEEFPELADNAGLQAARARKPIPKAAFAD